MRIYLSGPMTGHKKHEIEGWRKEASFLLSPFAEVIDPAKSYYHESEAFEKKETASEAMRRLRHGRFVVDRNKNLIRNCDALLVNFLGAKSRVSIGSIGEIYWANSFEKPIIIVRERNGNIHDHAMLNAIASQIHHDLKSACNSLERVAEITRQISNHA